MQVSSQLFGYIEVRMVVMNDAKVYFGNENIKRIKCMFLFYFFLSLTFQSIDREIKYHMRIFRGYRLYYQFFMYS